MTSAFQLTPNISRPTIRTVDQESDPLSTPSIENIPRPSIPSMVPPEVKTTHHNTLIPMEARVISTPTPPLISQPVFVPPPQPVPIAPRQPQIIEPQITMPNLPNLVKSTPVQDKVPTIQEILLKRRFISYFIPLDSKINNPFEEPKLKWIIISIKSVGFLILLFALFEIFSKIGSLNRFVYLEEFVLLSLVGIFLFIGEHMESFIPPHNPYRLRD